MADPHHGAVDDGDLPLFAWRICRERYADLSGLGAKRHGARWNSPGHAAVYLSADAALPIVEVLVHLDLPADLIPPDYVLMKVEIASTIGTSDPSDWLENGPPDILSEPDSRAFGDAWLTEVRTPLLRVPSIIVPESANIVLNPRHPLAHNISPATNRPFRFDSRLFDYGG